MVFPARRAAMRMGRTDCIARAALPQGLLPFRYVDIAACAQGAKKEGGPARGVADRAPGLR
jgi:hypothetical protein